MWIVLMGLALVPKTRSQGRDGEWVVLGWTWMDCRMGHLNLAAIGEGEGGALFQERSLPQPITAALPLGICAVPQIFLRQHRSFIHPPLPTPPAAREPVSSFSLPPHENNPSSGVPSR